MKEQNAAHSFEADFNVKKEHFEILKNAKVIRLTDGREFIEKEEAARIMGTHIEAELTRLRSELQQKNEVIRKILPLAHRAKSGLWANDPYCEYVDETIELAVESLKKQN